MSQTKNNSALQSLTWQLIDTS